ncbi:MAG: hypothetical protein MI919_24545 [Holophagales bacterium]|nr:hypothetical protein [Holophagales bacterium]
MRTLAADSRPARISNRGLPGLLAALLVTAAAPPAGAQAVGGASSVAPGDRTASWPGPASRALSRAEERRLQISIRRASDWEGQDWSLRELVVSRLGEGRMLELDRARFEYEMHAGDSLYRDAVRDLHDLDTAEDVVLSAYGKLLRETLEDSLGLEAWYDRRRAGWRLSSSPASAGGEDAGASQGRTAFRLRLSPRLSDRYVGLKVRMPATGIAGLDHLSFRARYDFETHEPRYTLKYDDGNRVVFLGYEPDTEVFGDEVRLSVRFLW